MTMRQLMAGSSLIALAVAAGVTPARAANLEAAETSSGLCGGQTVCLLPDDGNWDVTLFTQSSYNAATDTVTGSGAFAANTGANGSATVYLTAANGTTVDAIFSSHYSVTGSGGESFMASWQGDLDGALNLGTVPVGGTSLIETPGVAQLINAELVTASGNNFPSNITVETESDQVTVPAPLIGHGLPVLLAVGGILFGAKLLERGKRRRSPGGAIPHAAG
jgi:hypothetical protein